MENEYAIRIGNSLVVLYGPQYRGSVNKTMLSYREGVWCEKTETGEWMPDWNLTWFWKTGDMPENYFYYEQDPPETALHNLMRTMAAGNRKIRTTKGHAAAAAAA